MRILGRLWDLFTTLILFILMIMGYALYVILYPFYGGKRFLKYIVVTIIFLLLAGGVAYHIFIKSVTTQRNPNPITESVVIIERGATLEKIVSMLTHYRIIDSPLQFKILSILKGDTRKLKAGRYKLSNRMSVSEIVSNLAKGNVYNNTVLIPEGLPSWEIASLLSRNIGMDSSAFIRLVHDSAFAKTLSVDAGNLEGYLYPDTYIFPWSASPSEIIREMVRHSNEVYARNYKVNSITSKYSRHQILTMASIVEAEAAVDSERVLIAGVFYNRLRKKMPLGADPTVCFVQRKFGQKLLKKDLLVESPYNTRKFPNLPPGPIVNPGEASISAAINPAKTDMLYFVAKDDGSWEHYFTSNQVDHIKMKQLACETRNRIMSEKNAGQ